MVEFVVDYTVSDLETFYAHPCELTGHVALALPEPLAAAPRFAQPLACDYDWVTAMPIDY